MAGEESRQHAYYDASARWGVPLNFAIKEFHMYDVLSQLVELSAASGQKLVFKGGTALNKIYFEEDFQRFSEDLDFDDFSKGGRMARFRKLEELAGKIKGYEIGKGWRFRKVLRIECGYVLPSGQKDHVRIEFALQNPSSIEVTPAVLGMARFGIANASLAGVPTYQFEDLLARKILALAEREEGKDVYDVALGLQKIRGNRTPVVTALKMALKAEGKSVDVNGFIKKCEKRLGGLDAAAVMKLTNPYIPVPSRPKNWYELIETLRQRMTALLSERETGR